MQEIPLFTVSVSQRYLWDSGRLMGGLMPIGDLPVGARATFWG